MSSIATLLVLIHFASNPVWLFVRGVEGVESSFAALNADKTSGLLFDKFIRPMPFAALLVGLLFRCSRRTRIELFLLALLTNFPASLARNNAAMIWLPIIVVMFSDKFRHNLFMWLMMVAIFLLFPFFNLFRHWNGEMSFSWSMDFLNDINFDASQIFMAVLKSDFISYGRQLLGALLFFVPRAIWPTKPIGSGAELVRQMHGHFSNVSMPYFAEGYVNLGYLGILVFVVFLAWLCAKLDALYWYKWKPCKSVSCGYYLILLGAMVFIMRGDLMSSFAYTLGIMASYTICVMLTTSYHFTRFRMK